MNGSTTISASPARLALALMVIAFSQGFVLAQSNEGQLSPAALRSRQESQQRARTMARELVSTVLDLQLEQLRQNNLDKLEVYAEIETMRKNLDGLVEAEMKEVVELLAKAQEAPAEQRRSYFEQARAQSRRIITQLAIERQNLARRLKMAELAAQVKRLIELESRALATTLSIPEQAVQKQGETALAAIEDQHDVAELFVQLINTLVEVSRWAGQIGTGATEGLLILKQAQVGVDIDAARSSLEQSQFMDAADSERSAIRGLKKLLEKIEETQGLIGADREALLELVRELIRQQEAIRSEVRQENVTDQNRDSLVDKQQDVFKSLSQLEAGLQKYPAAEALVEQARAAANESVAKIFADEAAASLEEQGKILGSLAQIEELLKNAGELDSSDKTADQLAQMMKDLEAAKQELVKAEEERHKSDEANGPAQAAERLELAAATLAAADDERQLPAAVEARIDQAAKAAADAAAAVAGDMTAAVEVPAIAREAFERAASEIAAALKDTTRKQLAVKVGELARAAEALERAAATEREIAQLAQTAAQDDGLAAGQAKELAEEHRTVQQIASKTAEGVKNTAPAASRTLADAAASLAKVANAQAEANQKSGGENKEAAKRLANDGAAVARQLEQAARQLREEVGKTAGELIKVADSQLAEVGHARRQVDRLVTDQPPSIVERIERLDRAADRAAGAAAENQRAAGRPETAQQMELAHQIAKAITKQDHADKAAQELAAGRADDSFDAANRQHEAAEAAGNIAARAEQQVASESLAKELRRAEAAASLATKETLAGSPNAAERSRKEARARLESARQMAEAAATPAAAATPGEPNEAAARAAATAADEAKQLASADAPAAARSLDEAKSEAVEAAAAASKTDKSGVQTSTGAAAESLKQAAAEIASAKDELAKQQAAKLAAEAASMDATAKSVASIDPAAMTALAEARKTAASAASKPAPDAVEQNQSNIERNLQRAAATLGAREQQIERDKSAAEMIAQLASDTETAREEIVNAAERLNELARAGELTEPAASEPAAPVPSQTADQVPAGRAAPPTASPPAVAQPTPAAISAAQSLAAAEARFANALRATGQGAEQVSGQQQVANVPIREALEMASQLMTAGPGQLTGEGSITGKATSATEGAPAEGPAETPNENSGQGIGAGKGAGVPLGTAFVPANPEATAAMIAGSQANAAASAIGEGAGQGQAMGQGMAPGRQGGASPMSAGGGSSTAGPASRNQPPSDGPLQAARPPTAADSRAANDGGDTTNAGRSSRDEPWFARLPPEVRNAMRSSSKGRPPKGYEERLRRYFENVE